MSHQSSHEPGSQYLTIETPEQVHLDYEVAGLGSRTLAAATDLIILGVLLLLILLAAMLALGTGFPRLGIGLVPLPVAFGWGYYALFEGLWRGQTPGKRWMGIRVIRDSGHALSLGGAALRALLMPADLFLALGAFLILLHPRAKRLADLVAGTVVVRDHPIVVAEGESPPTSVVESGPVGAPELSEAEFEVLSRFVDRASGAPDAGVQRVASQLAIRFLAGRTRTDRGDIETLVALHAEEIRRRQGQLGMAGGSSRRGPGRRPGVERWRRRQAPRWEEFHALAERVSRGGLDVLGPGELLTFAARYREVAADLARARTYRADSAVLARLDRLVATGHNALYRDTRSSWRRLGRFLAVESPAAIIESGREVVLAGVVFTLPFLAGMAVLREQPALAAAVLPDVMLERAAVGEARQAAGEGYVLIDAADGRAAMAAGIMSNNIRVALSCFAGGVLFGVGSLVMLAYNGALLGASAGHFGNSGLSGYFWNFVSVHGVLEIFAICLAGAAGFMLGRAVLAPGRRARADALALAGRRAMRLVVMVILLLIPAALIEGLISASGATGQTRALVALGSALFLLALLAHGAFHAARLSPGERV